MRDLDGLNGTYRLNPLDLTTIRARADYLPIIIGRLVPACTRTLRTSNVLRQLAHVWADER